ncbi:hypothetical protein EMIT0P4_60232 [Pseudomonas sp. IT-P4]
MGKTVKEQRILSALFADLNSTTSNALPDFDRVEC